MYQGAGQKPHAASGQGSKSFVQAISSVTDLGRKRIANAFHGD
jgi:hypothetical protein